MLRAAARAEKTAIDHVGNPRERKPIGGIRRAEGPSDIRQIHAGHDMRVIGVIRVVIIQKLEMTDRRIYCQRRED